MHPKKAIKHGIELLRASFSLHKPRGRVLLYGQLCALGNSTHLSEPQSKDWTGFRSFNAVPSP